MLAQLIYWAIHVFLASQVLPTHNFEVGGSSPPISMLVLFSYEMGLGSPLSYPSDLVVGRSEQTSWGHHILILSQ
jgi:hypothetical protein